MKRSRPWESRQQRRAAELHAKNLTRIERGREQMAVTGGLKLRPDEPDVNVLKRADARLAAIFNALGRDYGGPIGAGPAT